jgi:hypothetical protein
MELRSEHPQSPESLDTLPAVPEPEKQLCANCNQAVPVTPDTWAFKPGGAPLKICKPCWHARKADSAQAASRPKSPKKDLPKKLDSSDVKVATKLDVALALKAGARVLNDQAEMVLARLISYAADPQHPQHWRALELLAERILPRKLYEELGGTAAGGTLADKRPQYVIQILPAQPNAPEGRIIDGQAQVVDITPTE